MTRRSRLLAALFAVLMIFIMVTVSGCTSGQNVFTRTKDGRLQHTEGSDVWILDSKSGSVQVTLNDKLFAVITGGKAQISLQGRTVDVMMDGSGQPVSLKVPWETVLTQGDYAQMSTAFYLCKQLSGQGQPGTLGWVIFLLIVIVAGVLLFFYAGRLVNSWKLGGVFSGRETAKSLLIVKALGIFVIVVGAIILLVVIF